MSSWAGDYPNTLSLIQRIQANKTAISHIHYSGGTPTGAKAIDDLLFADLNENERLSKLSFINFKRSLYFFEFKKLAKKVKHKFNFFLAKDSKKLFR